jgi:hypothetical protein
MAAMKKAALLLIVLLAIATSASAAFLGGNLPPGESLPKAGLRSAFGDASADATPGFGAAWLRRAAEFFVAPGEIGAAENAAGRQFWTESTEFQGSKVFQRSDLIDPNAVDALGRTNLQRMQSGLAPLGPDGESLNLHHLLQTQDGPLAEMTQTFHQQNSSVIHINDNSIPSGINRSAFNSWRQQYWINRAQDFGGGSP